ncbi:DUF2142 domain-containing protein [bacterium]|nr:DUF2142 domain-containing protein [bacterium]NBX98006.1 DUF2142 domain-containing protein [bacterium]NDC95511.1 DUF2142 domain-containing protein [bacterium]NDD84975.1 DUF2142 domain-containing protein [bacterium]NDG30167.1 DUF2142 domain-containing protein [bacterium]
MKKTTTYLSSSIKTVKKNIFSKPHLFFLVTSLLFGLTFLFLTPPLQGPDEQAHFLQAYKLTEGNFINDATDSYPVSLRYTYKTIMYNDDIRFNYKNKYEFWRTKDALKIPLSQQNREIGDGYMSGTSYSPIVYTGQSFMIFIGKLFNFAPVVLIYMARLGNLAVWIGLVYFAIKKSPIGKWPFAVLGIIPMALFQGAVITADAFLMGTLILFVAYILRLFVQKTQVTKKEYVVAAIIAACMALSKIIMLIFVPLVLMLLLKKHTENIKEPRMYSKYLGIAFVLFFATSIALVWSVISNNLSAGPNLPDGVYPPLQIHNLIRQPGEFLFALWNTNFYEWSDGITRSTIGTFGWADTPIALSFMVLGYLSLFVVMVANRGKDYINADALTSKLSRIFLIALGVVYFLAVSFAMYAYYSPVNYNIIVGLQGRYFLPIFVLPVLLFISKDQAVFKDKLYDLLVKVLPITLLSISVIYIIMRYYFHSEV